MNGELQYYLVGLLDGAAAALFIAGLYVKRAAKRRNRQIAEIIQTGDDLVADITRIPELGDGVIELPDTQPVRIKQPGKVGA